MAAARAPGDGRRRSARRDRRRPVRSTPTVAGDERRPAIVISSAAAPGSLPTRRFATARLHGSAAPDSGTPRCVQSGRPASWTVVSSPPSTTSRTSSGEGRTGRRRRAGGAPARPAAGRTAPRPSGRSGSSRRASTQRVHAGLLRRRSPTLPAGTRSRGLARRGVTSERRAARPGTRTPARSRGTAPGSGARRGARRRPPVAGRAARRPPRGPDRPRRRSGRRSRSDRLVRVRDRRDEPSPMASARPASADRRDVQRERIERDEHGRVGRNCPPDAWRRRAAQVELRSPAPRARAVSAGSAALAEGHEDRCVAERIDRRLAGRDASATVSHRDRALDPRSRRGPAPRPTARATADGVGAVAVDADRVGPDGELRAVAGRDRPSRAIDDRLRPRLARAEQGTRPAVASGASRRPRSGDRRTPPRRDRQPGGSTRPRWTRTRPARRGRATGRGRGSPRRSSPRSSDRAPPGCTARRAA